MKGERASVRSVDQRPHFHVVIDGGALSALQTGREEREDTMKHLNMTLPFATTEDVVSVYSGRPGCCCGCRGTHSKRAANKTRVLNVVKAALANDKKSVEIGDFWAAAIINNRQFIVYFA
jgi:hypothetical protein